METVVIQPSIAVLISLEIAIKAYKRKSLDVTGAVAGFIVMTLHLAISYRFGVVLLVFFFTSSKLINVRTNLSLNINDLIIIGEKIFESKIAYRSF